MHQVHLEGINNDGISLAYKHVTLLYELAGRVYRFCKIIVVFKKKNVERFGIVDFKTYLCKTFAERRK